MPASKKYQQLIQRVFREVDPTARVTDSSDQLNYHFQITTSAEDYWFICLRKPLEDRNMQEVRRIREEFLLTHPK